MFEIYNKTIIDLKTGKVCNEIAAD